MHVNKCEQHTKSHKPNFPNINQSYNEADRQGGEGLNNTRHRM